MASFKALSARLFLVLGFVTLFLQGTFAHTYLSSIFLDNEALADGDCVRPHPSTAYDSPIALLTDAGMTCGWLPQAAQAANRRCPIAAGSTIGLQWHHESSAPTDNIVDPTHVGPILVYLAKSDDGAGNVWFKIYEDGYTNGEWAVTKLIANNGRVDITLPSDIAPGNYLLRGEVLALHGAYAVNGVQPYVGCVELTISGNGNANPAGVAFPGYYSNQDPGMLFNIYSAFTSYIIPGPAVYKSGSSSSPDSVPSTPSAPTTRPTSAPSTAAPSTAPTTRPTSAPSVTSAPAPTSAPTSAPSSPISAENVKVGLNGGSNVWWVGAIISGGGETTVKVEMMDSGSVKSWTAMTDMSYAYVYSAGVQMTLPISLRLTSSSGNQVVLTNFVTSFTGGALVDTGKAYSSASSASSTSAPTNRPTSAPTSAPTNKPTSAPTSAPTNKPTSAPTSAPTNKPTSAATSAPSSGNNAEVTIYQGASEWWFALSVNADVSSVEIKDSGKVTAYTAMTANNWGNGMIYSWTTQGSSLVAPLSVRVTSKSGKQVTATITSITANAVVEASGSL